jgi:superfamily I DNA/RNA helicase
VVAFNQTIVPEFKYFPENQQGAIYQDREDRFLSGVSLGDMVVCRTNAPLFSCCLKLIRQQIPFKTTIKQFFEDTIILIKSFDCKSLDELHDHLLDWRDRKLESCTGAKADYAIIVDDQYEAIKVAIENSQSVDGLIKLLESVFKVGDDDDNDNYIGVSPKWIFLSSIHQAKGLEANRVWWLQYDLVPHPKARILEQETNLRWVAGTRAIDDLILVKSYKARTTLDEEMQDE